MRHIDADKLLESVTKNDFNDWLDYDIFEHFVKESPTADVVPKSEVEATVEKLMSATDKVICEAKAEVAREIFEGIEAIKCVGLLPSSWVTQFAELKKKYTEGEE